MKLVCPILSAGNHEEFENCIGSKCALWAYDDQKDNYGCCALACCGIKHGLVPVIDDDPSLTQKAGEKP